jgi:hypothetical protein
MGMKKLKPNFAPQHLPVFGCSQCSTIPSFHYSGPHSGAANFTPPGCNQSRPLWSPIFTTFQAQEKRGHYGFQRPSGQTVTLSRRMPLLKMLNDIGPFVFS